MKNNKKKVLVCLLSAIVIMGLVFFFAMIPATALAEPTVWKMQHILGPATYQSIELKRFASDVNSRSRGELKIEIFDSGGLGVPWSEMLSALQSGSISITEIPVAYMGGQNKFFGLEYLPLLITSVAEHNLAMNAIYDLRVQEFGKFNINPVAHFPYTNQSFACKKPLRTATDFKGLRIRTTSPEDASLVKGLGGIPITIPYTDVYIAAQRGSLDGFTSGVSSIAGLSAWEVFEYFNDVSWGMAGAVILVNKDAYNKLPADIRCIFLEEIYKLQERMHYLIKTDYEIGKNKLIQKGMKLIYPDRGLVADLKKISGPIWDKWAQNAGPAAQEGLKRIKVVLDK